MKTNDNEELKLTFDLMVKLCGGRDEAGMPCSSAILAIDDIKGKDVISNISSVHLENASIQLFYSGGCIVAEAIFPKTARIVSRMILNVCNNWINESCKVENRVLSLTIVPYKLLGNIMIVLNEMVYFRQCETEDIDYNEILRQVNKELEDEEITLDEELNQLTKEKEEYEQNNNIYSNLVNKSINGNIVDSSKTSKNSMIRHSD